MTRRRSLRAAENDSKQDGRLGTGIPALLFPILAAVCFVLGVGSAVLVYLFLPPWAIWAYGALSALAAAAVWIGKIRGR